MNDSPRLPREARHFALEQIGERGQSRIREGSVLVVGAGGIGCAVLQYLVAAGVGRVVVCDFDTVDPTNLARQVLYRESDVGKSKVESAAAWLRAQNPAVDIEAIDHRLDGEELHSVVRTVDLVLDGSDNFATRFAISDACVAAGKALISGSAIRFEGQLAVFGPDYDRSPSYRCLYAEPDESLDNCAGNGVLGPVPGVIGTLMAVEALKLLAGIEVRTGRLWLFDAVSGESRSIAIKRRERRQG